MPEFTLISISLGDKTVFDSCSISVDGSANFILLTIQSRAHQATILHPPLCPLLPLLSSDHGRLHLRKQRVCWWLFYLGKSSRNGMVSQKSLPCLLSYHGARCRRGLPHDLDREMEDIRRKGEEVEEVSIGLDGDWFLRTNTRHGTFLLMSKPRTPINPINPRLKQETTML